MHASLIHPALYALGDVTLAVDHQTLSVVDVNRASRFLGFTREELFALALDALAATPRADLERRLSSPDAAIFDVTVRGKTGELNATARVTALGAHALVTFREAPFGDEKRQARDEIEKARALLGDALRRLEPAVASPPEPEPVEVPSRASIPDLTPEHYASLVAETEVHPTRRIDIQRRYGLATDAARAELDRVWSERFSRDPSLLERGRLLEAHYRDWFEVQARRLEESSASMASVRSAAMAAQPRAQAQAQPQAQNQAVGGSASSVESPASLQNPRPVKEERTTAPRAPADIDLAYVAAALGAVLVHARLDRGEGATLRAPGGAVLTVDERLAGTPEGCFVGAHEAGHLVLHPDVGLSAWCRGASGSFFQREIDASDFGSRLLTPGPLVEAWLRGAAALSPRGFTLHAARAFAGVFAVPLATALLRLVARLEEPLAAVCTRAGNVRWCPRRTTSRSAHDALPPRARGARATDRVARAP